MDLENKLRLLICEHCGSVEEMPMYEGHWKQDTWLNEKLKGHMTPSGEKTHGDVHVGIVEADKWMLHRGSILAQMATEFTMPGKGAGLGVSYYDTKSNFQADAFKCWQQHNRTTNCQDYKSDSKRLLPDTKMERKELGLDIKSRPNTFLCDFCPYHAHVVQLKRKKEGYYNYNP